MKPQLAALQAALLGRRGDIGATQRSVRWGGRLSSSISGRRSPRGFGMMQVGPWRAVPNVPNREPQTPAAHAEDFALAQAVARGERAAADAFARRLLPLVRRIAHCLARDDEGNDATQMALLELLQSAGSYRGVSSLEAWGRKVAARAALRHVKRVRAKATHASRPLDEVNDPRPATMRTTVIDELPRPLEDYLDELPEVQRTAVVLRHSLGHTIPEIAALTESAVPTVKSRLQKAQSELRRLIRRDLNLGVRAPARQS